MKSLSLLAIILTLSAATAAAQPGARYSGQLCQSWFKANDRNGDGALGTRENSTKFLSRVTLANDERGEYIMSKVFFMMECKIGSFGRPPA